MIQATTPTVVLTLPETVDLTTAREIYVSFRQRSAPLSPEPYSSVLTKTLGADVWLTGTHIINVYLSQAETLAFEPCKAVEVQVNWITAGGDREATLIETIKIFDNIIDSVIGDDPGDV